MDNLKKNILITTGILTVSAGLIFITMNSNIHNNIKNYLYKKPQVQAQTQEE